VLSDSSHWADQNFDECVLLHNRVEIFGQIKMDGWMGFSFIKSTNTDNAQTLCCDFVIRSSQIYLDYGTL